MIAAREGMQVKVSMQEGGRAGAPAAREPAAGVLHEGRGGADDVEHLVEGGCGA